MWRRLNNQITRPHYGLYATGSAPLALNIADNGILIKYYDWIDKGDEFNEREADIIQAVPGGYLKMFMYLNQGYISQLTYYSIRVRIITFRLINYDITTIPSNCLTFFDTFWDSHGGSRMNAVRNLDRTSMLKVLSDKTISLNAQYKLNHKIFHKHNWKGKVMWDASETGLNKGFYYTLVITDQPTVQENAPILVDYTWKSTWLNVT